MLEVAWLVFVVTSLVLIVTPGQDMILVAGVMIAPIAHRILHRFHMESRNR